MTAEAVRGGGSASQTRHGCRPAAEVHSGRVRVSMSRPRRRPPEARSSYPVRRNNRPGRVRLGVGGWRLEDGGWKMEVGGWKMGVGNSQPPTSNLQPPTSYSVFFFAAVPVSTGFGASSLTLYFARD